MSGTLSRAASYVQDLHTRIALALLLCFILLTGLSITDANVYTPDSARYAVWAVSISQGNGYLDWTDPEPSRYVVHAPLYPLVLAPFAWFSTAVPNALKYGSFLIAVIMLVVLYRFVKSQTSGLPATVAVGCLAFNPLTVLYSTQLLSEPLFLLLLTLLFGLLHRLSVQHFTDLRTMAMMVVVLGAAVLTREIGIVLLPVVLLFLLMHKRYDMAGWTFVGVILMFGAWYVRNEIIIAGREQPVFRNAVLFSSSILTSGRDAFIQELLTRFTVNVEFYSRELPGLFFYPQFSLSGDLQASYYAVVDRSALLMQAAQRIVAPAHAVTAVVAGAVIILGAVNEFQKGTLFSVYSGFLAAYTLMVLLYPVTDIRFLFPVLMVLLIVAARGVHAVMRKGNVRLLRIVYASAVLAMLPNVLWCISFADEAVSFRRPAQEKTSAVPEYSYTFESVAEWFRGQGLQPSVVMAKRKEIGIVLPGTKVILLGGFTGLSTFERMIRDYEIEYIIATKDGSGWHEFEMPMNLCRRYSFQQVHSAYGYDIYRILPPAKDQELQRTEPMIRYLFHHLEQGNFPVLREFFRSDPVASSTHYMFTFFRAVTLEALGSLDSSRALFASLQRMPQGIALKRQIGFHSALLEQMEELRRMTDSTRRAETLFNIALNYWELDLRTTALRYLNATVLQQRSYIPAYNLFIHFSLQTGDTANAKGAFEVMRREFPHETAVPLFASLFETFDAEKTAGTRQERADWSVRRSGLYAQLGLTDASLASLRAAHLIQPEREDLALRLSSAYQDRLQFYPAFLVLKRTLARSPASSGIAAAIDAITGRY